MKTRSFRVSAPGKLFIAGEWAVLDGFPAIVTAIDRRCHAHFEPIRRGHIRLTRSAEEEIEFKCNDVQTMQLMLSCPALEHFRYALSACYASRKLLGKLPACSIALDSSELEHSPGRKLGVGSSSAITVAVAGGLLKILGYDIASEQGKLLLFFISYVAHCGLAQQYCGSGADVAAAIFGGTILYRRPRRGAHLLKAPRQLQWPDSFELLFGFSGRSVQTTDMLSRVDRAFSSAPCQFQSVKRSIAKAVRQIAHATRRADLQQAQDGMRANHRALLEFTKISAAPIVSEAHNQMLECVYRHGGAGKISGAGGGDIAIALSPDKNASHAILESWRKLSFQPLSLRLCADGVRL